MVRGIVTMIQIAVMGHGVVGSGVTEILLKHTDKIAKKVNEEVCIKKVLDLREFPDSPIADRFTKDFNDIISDDEISVVVEVMGGLKPAYDFVKQCLEKGKSVVTSNKELVAAKGAELLKIAEEKNVNFLFEASVGGAIPIIRPLHQCLAANDIEKINGILNGTTNFILNKMINDNMSFEDALALAQQAGNAKSVNIVLMGRLAKYFDIAYDKWVEAIKVSVKPQFVEVNLKAFDLGYNY